MFDNEHTCCICREKHKHVQIHHIDNNPKNNDPNNLCVVCNDCHSKVTSDAGLGRRYTQGELRMYKRSWEYQVQKKRETPRAKVTHQKELVTQIDLLTCEILSIKDGDKRVKEKLNVLWELHLYRGVGVLNKIDTAILEAFEHLALISAMNSPVTSSLVAEKLWELCFHFVGPENVKMDKGDKGYVERCLRALNTLGSFSSEYLRKEKVTKAYCKYIFNFYEIATWYNFEELAVNVLRGLQQAKKGCLETFNGKSKAFKAGSRIIESMRRKISRNFKKENLKWKKFSISLTKELKK